jgi:copper(I)-binding protein
MRSRFRHTKREMTMTRLTFIAAGAFALFAVSAAQSHSYRLGDLTINHPWARPTAEGAKNGAVYLSIKNGGKDADKIVSVESPVAGKTGIHETLDENGVMKMRPVQDGVEIKPGASQEFKPGGYHIMLFDLKKRLQEGETVPLTMTFAKAGSINVDVKVEKTAPDSAEAAPMEMHGMKGMDHSMH